MYCDRSAYYQKAIKATARRFKINNSLAVAFFAFWAISFYNKMRAKKVINIYYT